MKFQWFLNTTRLKHRKVYILWVKNYPKVRKTGYQGIRVPGNIITNIKIYEYGTWVRVSIKH